MSEANSKIELDSGKQGVPETPISLKMRRPLIILAHIGVFTASLFLSFLKILPFGCLLNLTA